MWKASTPNREALRIFRIFSPFLYECEPPGVVPYSRTLPLWKIMRNLFCLAVSDVMCSYIILLLHQSTVIFAFIRLSFVFRVDEQSSWSTRRRDDLRCTLKKGDRTKSEKTTRNTSNKNQR